MNSELKAAFVGALIGVVGTLGATFINGHFSLKAQEIQKEVQVLNIRSQAAVQLLKYYSEPVEELNVSLAKLHGAKNLDEMKRAAREVAIFAAKGSVRMKGNMKVHFVGIVRDANNLAFAGSKDEASKIINSLFESVKALTGQYIEFQKEYIDASVPNA